MSSAYGKVILLGEHSVVYGRPALAAAFTPGVDATARTPADGLTLHVSPWNCSFRPGDGTDLGSAIECLGAFFGVTGAHLDATLHLPGGGGLGSSAALGVACARALCAATGEALDDARLLDAALAWEKVFHGNPSGVDHTLAALGGVGVYVRGEGLRRVALRAPVRFCLGDTGERASTRDMVDVVARAHARRTDAVERTFDAIASLVRNAALALEVSDVRVVGELMNLKQALLASLMVSTERIETLCRAARDAGAHGAKLTGAGGGGCVIAVPGDREAQVIEAWREIGVPSRVIEVGA